MSRELIGALTQARVQLIAAEAILEERVGMLAMKMSTGDDGSLEAADTKAEYDAVVLDKQKLARAAAVIADVRAGYERPNKP